MLSAERTSSPGSLLVEMATGARSWKTGSSSFRHLESGDTVSIMVRLPLPQLFLLKKGRKFRIEERTAQENSEKLGAHKNTCLYAAMLSPRSRDMPNVKISSNMNDGHHLKRPRYIDMVLPSILTTNFF